MPILAGHTKQRQAVHHSTPHMAPLCNGLDDKMRRFKLRRGHNEWAACTRKQLQ